MEITTKRQMMNYPLPEISESNDSELCIKATNAIRNKDNNELKIIISNPIFDINERFDTSYMQRENYLNYSIFCRNFEAAKIILNKGGLQLDECDKQDMLNRMTLQRKYLLLYHFIKQLETNLGFVDYVSSVATLNYSKVQSNK